MDNVFIPKLSLKPRRRENRKFIWILLLLTLIGIIFTYLYLIQPDRNKAKLASPLSKEIFGRNKLKLDNSLKSVVDKALEGTKGSYGIVIKSLKTDKLYFTNEHKEFETGSLYKLWIMATVYQQIQEGKLTKDQILSEDVSTLNEIFNIDSDTAELTEGTVTFSVRDALKQMITISHNYAALLLTKKIKLSSVAAFLKDNGFDESSVGTDGSAPKSTPSDIALFFEKLYKEELANKQYTQEMTNLLKAQQLDDGIPKYLPDESKVANKTGDIGWFKHDAGIVYTDKGNYIISVMSESDYPPDAQERIALVSKAVFDYFSKP